MATHAIFLIHLSGAGSISAIRKDEGIKIKNKVKLRSLKETNGLSVLAGFATRLPWHDFCLLMRLAEKVRRRRNMVITTVSDLPKIISPISIPFPFSGK